MLAQTKSLSLTIDKIIEELRLSRIDFIKMDIKGSTEDRVDVVPSYRHFRAPCLLDQKQVYLDTLLFED